jgi:serine/threonine-protein kinase
MNCPFCKAENDPAADTCFSCGRGLFSLTRGTVLSDRYEIQATLGRGGMGMVYKAYDRELDETVAIKLLRPDIAQSPDASRRFRNEIRLARRVRHRNVCAIHEYGQQGHLRYIAMEYLAGTDFKQILRSSGPLPGPEACRVAIQVAEALQAMHEAGIVHRDLKTPNIMRDERGMVRLMDFGIAKVFEGESASAATGTGLVVGTPEYMSPEQARGEKVDARADIYALGVVLHELLTGEVPLRGDTPIATLMKHVSEKPGLDSPLLPEELRTILQTALAKDRQERYRSADDMASALRAVLQSYGPQVASAPAARPPAVAIGGALRAETQPAPVETTPLPTPVPTAVPTQVPTPVPRSELARRTDVMPAPAAPTLPPPLPRPTDPQRRLAARPPAPAASRARSFSRGALIVASMAVLGLGWFAVQRLREAAPAPAAPGTVGAAAPAPGTTPPSPERMQADAAARPAEPLPESPRQREVEPTAAPIVRQPVRPPSPASARAEPPSPVAAPVLIPTPASAPTPAPSPEAAPGLLQVGAKPYADVIVDGRPMGTTPMSPLSLAAGAHVVRLVHADYQPFQRRITIRPGETTKLFVDFALDGIPK